MRANKYFRSVKITPMLKDCPLTASMILLTRLYSLTFVLGNPKSAFGYISVIQLQTQMEDLIFCLHYPASPEAPWGTLSGRY